MTRRNVRPAPPLFTRAEKIIGWLVGLSTAGSLIALVMWNVIFVQILPGQVGVRYHLLGGGTDVDTVLPEGYALKLPWDRIYIYEARIQQFPFQVRALSQEGMMINIRGNVLYRPQYRMVARLQRDVGPDYRARLVGPIAIAAIREQVAKNNSHELYSIDYDHLRDEIIQIIAGHPASELIDFADILITSIDLPPNVTQAIELKLAQEQLAASYEFRLLAQKQEAERRRIEAIGIQTFYSIVSEALTDTLLTWRGIEATVDLAKSNNSKIVIVGGGKDDMPLILGSDITAQPSSPSPIPSIPASEQTRLPDWSNIPALFPEISQTLNASGAVGTDPFHPSSNRQSPQGSGTGLTPLTGGASSQGSSGSSSSSTLIPLTPSVGTQQSTTPSTGPLRSSTPSTAGPQSTPAPTGSGRPPPGVVSN